MNAHDDFLTDPEAMPDAEVEHLERLLSAYHRDPPELPELPPREAPDVSRRMLLVAAAAAVVVIFAGMIWRTTTTTMMMDAPAIASDTGEAMPSLPAASPVEDGPATFAPPLASEPADCTAPGDQGAFLAAAPVTEEESCMNLTETECEQRTGCRVVRGERYRSKDSGWCLGDDREFVGCVATPESCSYEGTASVGVGDDKQYWEVDGCLPGWVPCDLPDGSVSTCEPVR